MNKTWIGPDMPMAFRPAAPKPTLPPATPWDSNYNLLRAHTLAERKEFQPLIKEVLKLLPTTEDKEAWKNLMEQAEKKSERIDLKKTMDSFLFGGQG